MFFVRVIKEVVKFPVGSSFLSHDLVSLLHPSIPAACVKTDGFGTGFDFTFEKRQQAHAVIGSICGEVDAEGVENRKEKVACDTGEIGGKRFFDFCGPFEKTGFADAAFVQVPLPASVGAR